MENNNTEKEKISLIGSVSLGTGVMIGAGIFVLMGQIAALVGDLFPLAFVAGAVVVGFSSYSFVKFSNAYPSSGGIASFLNKSYGPGTATGTFSLLMYVSMVIAESLVASTFGSYTLRLFPAEYSGYGSIFGVLLITIAYIVNISGNKIIETTATFAAITKVGGIAILAISGLVISGLPDITGQFMAGDTQPFSDEFTFIAALALSILAYKGFTTITNQGGDIINPHKNVGRSIILSIAVCTVIYVILALSVAGALSFPEIIAAKDYALAAAAKPVFGSLGSTLTIILAIVATVSGIIASVYSASRMLGMLSGMKQVPNLKKMGNFKNPALIFTVSLAILLTISFDLTRIASLGAIFYLIMDIAIHWGLFRYLRKEIKFNPIIPLLAIFMDLVVLSAFIYLKYVSDPFVIVVSIIGILLIIISERLFMKSHTDDKGVMHMEMDENEGKMNM